MTSNTNDSSVQQAASLIQVSAESAAGYRPVYHFTPSRDWLSDPNGLVYVDGTFHLCYQFDQYGAIFENMSWGHAVSSNLLDWHERAPVITPDENLGMCFSGCMVVDKNDTAGFGRGAMIGFYTSELPKQQQSMFVSVDNGQSFRKFPHNPVIASTETTAPDFRDPKVFWCDAADCWMMSVAGPERIEFWSSRNLTQWRFESQFGSGHGVHGVQWECPDLRYMSIGEGGATKQWVLLVSVNPGAPNGGSGTMYFLGDFRNEDGVWRFVSDHVEPKWLDWGCDNYAHVGWSNLQDSDYGDRVLSIGWMNNWNYATALPTAPWRGAMTLIRELRLEEFSEGLVLTARPGEMYGRLHGDELLRHGQSLVFGQPLRIGDALSASRIELEFSSVGAAEVGVEFSSDIGDVVRIGYAPGSGYFVDRNSSGDVFHEDFPGRHFAEATSLCTDPHFEIYLDRCSVEAFFGRGEYSISDLIFPRGTLTTVTPYSTGIAEVTRARVTQMRGIKISPDGTVDC